MESELRAGSERQDLIDIAHDALDQYEVMESDLSALVSDFDGVIGQLRPLCEEAWVAELHDAWRRLAAVREEASAHEMSELNTHTVTVAVHELRTLLDQ